MPCSLYQILYRPTVWEARSSCLADAWAVSHFRHFYTFMFDILVTLFWACFWNAYQSMVLPPWTLFSSRMASLQTFLLGLQPLELASWWGSANLLYPSELYLPCPFAESAWGSWYLASAFSFLPDTCASWPLPPPSTLQLLPQPPFDYPRPAHLQLPQPRSYNCHFNSDEDHNDLYFSLTLISTYDPNSWKVPHLDAQDEISLSPGFLFSHLLQLGHLLNYNLSEVRCRLRNLFRDLCRWIGFGFWLWVLGSRDVLANFGFLECAWSSDGGFLYPPKRLGPRCFDLH